MTEVFDTSQEEFNFDDIMGEEQKAIPNPEKLIAKVDKSTDKKIEQQMVKSITNLEKDPQDIKKHQELVLHLSRYGSSKRFAEYLNALGFHLTASALKKQSVSDLQELLQRVQTSLDNKGTSNFWSELSLGAVQTGELIVVNSGLNKKIKIKGLTDALRNNDEYLDLVELLELSYTNFTHVRPEIRLVYTVMSSAMKLHAVNSFMEKREEAMKESGMIQEKEEKSEIIQESILDFEN